MTGRMVRTGLVGLVALVAVGGVVATIARRRPPARIVLVVIDTLRRDHVSLYGSAARTPTIDALAADGTVFRSAVGAFHQTTMSMAALFTGRTPSIESTDPASPLPWIGDTWCGMSRFAKRDDDPCLPPAVPTLAEALRARGYRTAGVVSNPLLFRPAGYDRGFDDWIEVGGKENRFALEQDRDDAVHRAGSKVNRAVRDWLARRGGERFFLYVHYMDAHDWLQRGMSYEDAVQIADGYVGDLRRALAEAGVLDGTTIVLTADHGESLGEVHALPGRRTHFGNPSFETVLEVPLVVSPPVSDDAAGLRRSDDTFRLLLRLAGLPAAPPPDLADDELFLTEQRYRTYRRGRWKSMWPRDGGPASLFDLIGDPGEEHDVATEHPDEVASHRRRIDELSRTLAGTRTAARALSPDEEGRLRSLGYVQ